MEYLTIYPGSDIEDYCSFLQKKGGGVLKLFPGRYEQNIDFPGDSNLVIEGSGLADLDFTVISGSHKLPNKGKIGFSYLKLESRSSNFSCDFDSSVDFLFYSCCLQADDGWSLNIPGYSGNGTFFDEWIKGENNGFVNNSSGMGNFKFYNLTSESKNKNAEMILPHKSLFFGAYIKHLVRPNLTSDNFLSLGGSEIYKII